MLLEVDRINTFYGLSQVLFNVSLEIDRGEVVVLLGRNGAGKTTTMVSIIGLNPPKSGRIVFKGKEITGLAPYKASRMGIGFVPEDRRIFPDLTVAANLDVGRRNAGKKANPWTPERIYQVFPVLEQLAHRRGGTLSGGEQQMLTIARTLMTNPELILLDEPSEGLAPLVVRMLGSFIDLLKKEGVTVLLSEQNVKFAFKHSDRAYIIDKGMIKYQGTIAQLEKEEEIKKQYLAV
jgi:branched-chain amino acid transport system ATP-binding protein